jgi:anti-sigma regulatory factor (Ser/Thr protein kinase)
VSDVACDAELRISSNLIYLRPVRVFVRELAENMGFCRERVSNIELAVDEVLSNAIEHGSAGSGSRILVRCSLTGEMMRITISDAGRGKSSSARWIDAWSDVTKEKIQPGTERGHGLLLVRSLIDEIRMESNSVGGADVHLVVHKERQRVTQR